MTQINLNGRQVSDTLLARSHVNGGQTDPMPGASKEYIFAFFEQKRILSRKPLEKAIKREQQDTPLVVQMRPCKAVRKVTASK